MRHTQRVRLFNKRVIFSAVYFDLVDFGCRYEPTPLSSMLSILANLLLLCFLLFRGGVLQVPRTCLCFALLCCARPCLSITQTYGLPYVEMSGGPFRAIIFLLESAADYESRLEVCRPLICLPYRNQR